MVQNICKNIAENGLTNQLKLLHISLFIKSFDVIGLIMSFFGVLNPIHILF